jgi:hypothetical protein
MKSFIRVAEVWVPDTQRTLLEFGGGVYRDAGAFAAVSRSMCFGRAEGLPGRAWDSGRPMVLKDFEGSDFRRVRTARAAGLSCAVAVPFFMNNQVTAVLVLFCGDQDEGQAGAIELWHNATNTPDLTLDDGYYGKTAELFEFVSRNTRFRRGTGLPGLCWEAGLPVYMPDLGKGSRFIRADSAVKVGINRGFALPCSTGTGDHFVLTFLSALATPLASRVETWEPEARSGSLRRREGFCETAGALGAGGLTVAPGEGVLGKVLLTGAPMVSDVASEEPGAIGQTVRELGTAALLVFPIIRDNRVRAVTACYL